MQKLYFIRHGEAQDNADERWPRYDTPLTSKGREQARTAGQKAKADSLHFDIIIASPQPRALETAQLIAAEIGFPVDRIETSDQLLERDMGQLTGTHPSVFFTPGITYQDTDNAPGVEKIADVQVRAGKVLDELKAQPEAAILVVGHGIFGRALRRVTLGLPYTDEFRDPMPHDMIPNATIIQLI